LLDGERDSPGPASGGIAIASRACSSCARTSGSVIESAKFVDVIPGEMIVTRRSWPASWRSPSEIARTAIFVPAYTD